MRIFKTYFPLSFCVILFCIQVLEVAHAEGPDCEDLHCLVCHANMDKEHVSSSQLLKTNFILLSLNLNHRALLLDKASKALLPIRAPPSRAGCKMHCLFKYIYRFSFLFLIAPVLHERAAAQSSEAPEK